MQNRVTISREIRGVESQGMILMAENAKEELGFVSPADDKIEAGNMVS